MGLYLGHTGPYKIGKKYKLYIGRKNQGHVHNFVLEQTVNATCTTEGYLLYRCSCNVTSKDIIPALGHTGGEATCTQKAVCTRCGNEYGEYADHNYGTTWKTDDTYHWHECSCGAKKDFAAHGGGIATCSARAVCEVCGEKYGELDSDNHDLDCNCGHQYCQHFTYGANREEVSLYEDLPTIEATCTKDGREGGRKCSSCGSYDPDNEPQIIPRLGHTGGTATCTEQAVCTRCGESYGELDAHYFIDGVCDNCSYVCEHTDVDEETWECNDCNLYVYCLKNGHDIGDNCTCNNCLESFHDWETLDWFTDDNVHQELKKCSKCEEEESGDLEPHVPGANCRCTVCDADAHDWITEEEEIPATCTTPGSNAIVRCGTCTKLKYDSGATIQALGHIDEDDDGRCDRCNQILTCPTCGKGRDDFYAGSCSECGSGADICDNCGTEMCSNGHLIAP